MTDDDFRNWAINRGMDASSIADLIRYAPKSDQLKGPPLYTLDRIRTLDQTCRLQSIPTERFVIVFRFRNGDRVGIDVSDDIGAVYYIADTQELDGVPNLPALKAFPSVKRLVHACFNDDEIFPESYVEALSLLK